MSTSAHSNDYINIDDALKRLGGNMGLYKQLLNRFDGNGYISEIEEALRTNDKEKASHSIHSLKGVGANLSLEKLRFASAELEGALAGGADCSACLELLKEELKITQGFIADIIQG